MLDGCGRNVATQVGWISDESHLAAVSSARLDDILAAALSDVAAKDFGLEEMRSE